MAAYRLTQFEAPKDGWYTHLQFGIAPWPENKNRQQWMNLPVQLQTISNNLLLLHSAFPKWQDGPVPIVSFGLDTNGNFFLEAVTLPALRHG